MKAPFSFTARAIEHPWVRNPWRRRGLLAVLGLIFALLALFPQQYLAEAELMPQTSGGGLSSMVSGAGGGALLDLGSLTGSHNSIEADLTIARSYALLPRVAAKLKQQFPTQIGDPDKSIMMLRKRIDVIAIRGSILQITAQFRDKAFAKAAVTALAEAVQERLAEISVSESGQKRAVTNNRLASASAELARSQEALTNFRLTHRLAAPEAQLGAGVGVLTGLQGQLQARQTALSALRQVATSNNIQVAQLEAEIGSLKSQITQIQSSGQGAAPTLGNISEVNAQYLNLFRDERAAEMLYQIYSKYSEELTIDDLSASQALTMIEPPFIHPERQFNGIPLALFFFIVGLAILAETYMFAPPLNGRYAADHDR